MNWTIREQRERMAQSLYAEQLRERESNLADIKNFEQISFGSLLSNILIDQAWKDDENRNSKYFLVRDRYSNNQIAFYYSLNCGIVYNEHDYENLSPTEQKLVNDLIRAYKTAHTLGLSSTNQQAADKLYNEALGALYENIEDLERLSRLSSFAVDKATTTIDEENSRQVKETFPAIEIKLLCRNAKYMVPQLLDFKLGVFIFWDIIVPHILKLSESIGCKYIYLFAADNSATTKTEQAHSSLGNQAHNIYADSINSDKFPARKLVNYYMEQLKFKPSTQYTVLKPEFDLGCLTLIQRVSDLEDKRAQIWASHDEG